jgi:D-threo-aldose 1-dehydrogenase
LYLHDPERMSFEAGMADDGAVSAMLALKAEGVVDHLGVAGGDVALLERYYGTGAFEVILNHNRFTLLDQSAVPLLEQVVASGGAFVNAAPYGGGMLVKGPVAQPKYAYGNRGDALTARVLAMQRACAEFDVPLAAAALQFSVRDERIASTAVGLSSPERVEQTAALLEVDIPTELWTRLLALTPPPEEWLS